VVGDPEIIQIGLCRSVPRGRHTGSDPLGYSQMKVMDRLSRSFLQVLLRNGSSGHFLRPFISRLPTLLWGGKNSDALV
jgi:hypothetical protein